jgi:DNA (cytosine-5)-methyltransferase 1
MSNRRIINSRKPVFIDLFAGAGGLSIGLERAGFKMIAATDWDHWSCETLRTNHPGAFVYEGDIQQMKPKEFAAQIGTDKVDLIVGGPPCQGFSQLGKRDKNDPRNAMWKEYMRFVDYFKPSIFLIENVPQLLKSVEFEGIKKKAESLGYEVAAEVLHAADYGVPQKRKRVIIIGSLIGTPTHPEPTHRSPDKTNLLNVHLPVWRTVRDAIANLPKKPNGKNWHVGRNPTAKSLARYKHIPEGGNRFNLPSKLTPQCWKNKPTGSTDLFGRLSWDKPALTIRTEFFKPEKGRYLHPAEHRPITIREAARIQTFPDDYILVGSHVAAAKQIGNAVPCLFAERIGEKLLDLLKAPADSIQQNRVYRQPVLES